MQGDSDQNEDSDEEGYGVVMQALGVERYLKDETCEGETLRESRGTLTGPVKAHLRSQGRPRQRQMSMVFPPRLLLKPSPPSPRRAMIRVENASGMLPPAARNVSPITESGMPIMSPEIRVTAFRVSRREPVPIDLNISADSALSDALDWSGL